MVSLKNKSNYLKSVSTITTYNLLKEFFILEYSLRLTNPDTKMVVLCDDISYLSIKELGRDHIILINELENINYNDLKNRGSSWLDFMLKKGDVIDKAVALFGETLFVDTDIVFLNRFEDDIKSEMCLSQHLIFEEDEAKYGKYNGGYFFVKNVKFSEWFRKTTYERSTFYEQGTLNFVEEDFDTSFFNSNHNYGWWRLFQCSDIKKRFKKFGYDDNVYYNKKPLISVHAHFISDGKNISNDQFVEIIMELLSVSEKAEHKLLFDFITKLKNERDPNKPKIILPHPAIAGHCGDTFRELVNMWGDKGLCDVVYTVDSNHVWLNSIGDVLLYDRPTLEWLGNENYRFALFGNPVVNYPHTSPWIFWGRRPALMEELRELGIKTYSERNIESIFLGKVENNIQLVRRTDSDWSKSVEIFEMPIDEEYKYSQKEYLEIMSRSRFSLELPGYGLKTNRLIESLSLGVVPIKTPNADLTFYNQLKEGKHYLRVNKPEEVKPLIHTITEEKWNEMSKAGLDWYEENCSPIGSFNTTMKIINEHADQ